MYQQKTGVDTSVKKTDTDKSIKVVITNPPTKEQAEERIKKLSAYLGQIWYKPQNIR